jgi:N-acetylmuramic acid 6-phosphate etherase
MKIIPQTEKPSESHTSLDQYSALDLVRTFADDQMVAVRAVQDAAAQIAAAVEAALPRLEQGGRLIYVGAGTSGRLGLLDSVELYPTFSWPPERAVALLAGGQQALFRAVEGAEDQVDQGVMDIRAQKVGPHDVVILLAASGGTPYTMGALEEARRLGALTIGIGNNIDSPVALKAECGITLDTGSELISGSTRLKAGTAQKITLNTLSSSIMVKLNKTYGNLMVDLKPTNAKLKRRAERLTVLATGIDEATARSTLEACNHQVKTAIVAILAKVDVAEAAAKLDAAHGSVRAAILR